MNTQVTLEDVSGYRQYLSDLWQIRPAEYLSDIYSRMDPADAKVFREWMERLSDSELAEVAEFYRWMASVRRMGPVHSFKWSAILSSGVWAASVLRALAPEGPVLDLGCNAGYWTGWVSSLIDQPMVGVDDCSEAIEFGRRRLATLEQVPQLSVADFTDPFQIPESFSVAVSLQALGDIWSRTGNCDVLDSAADRVVDGGYLILVDRIPEDLAVSFENELDKNGLAIEALGLNGGLGIDQEWGTYSGIVLRKGSRNGPSYSEAWDLLSEHWAKSFAPYANTPGLDWSERNTAYWYASGGKTLVGPW